VTVCAAELLVVFVAPPWGDALDAELGLDLRHTQPPVIAIVELVAKLFAGQPVLLVIQVHETVRAESLAQVRSVCCSSAVVMYALDAPGRNHGVLLATIGWRT
jgi:hypothetical protein